MTADRLGNFGARSVGFFAEENKGGHRMQGYVHSIESMGLVDGPGIRTVVFLQGCSLRCRYCHNPDTWCLTGGETVSAEVLVKRLCRYKAYFDRSGGGVTFSGGEPLMQYEFLREALALCHQNGLHTCLDTAGVGLGVPDGGYENVLANTDLVLYDVKHWEPTAYQALTGRDMAETNRFLEALGRAEVPVWVRHVVVPGLTDSEQDMLRLREYIDKLPGVQKVELLPYHLLGTEKYKKMGIAYSLEDVPAMDAERVRKWQDTLFVNGG